MGERQIQAWWTCWYRRRLGRSLLCNIFYFLFFTMIFWWLFFSFLVWLLWSNRKIGFWWAFLLSLVLSPLIGLIFTLVSKSKEDSNNHITGQRNIEYQNYVNSRNNFPDSFTVSELLANEVEIRLNPSEISNSEIWKPISIKWYHKKSWSKVREWSKIVQLMIWDKFVDYTSLADWTVRLIHKEWTYLMPNDVIYYLQINW